MGRAAGCKTAVNLFSWRAALRVGGCTRVAQPGAPGREQWEQGAGHEPLLAVLLCSGVARSLTVVCIQGQAAHIC